MSKHKWEGITVSGLNAWMMNLRQKWTNWFGRFFRDERGATIAEYAILLAVVVVALIVVLGQLTDALEEKLLEIITEIGNAPTH